ncbi:hypothetical protein HanRHA438_Chr02g0057961 [Helianthus annuus]|nr:hypothetical protein HanRHA438_Chr02g0057961 [Helianthus annuus]
MCLGIKVRGVLMVLHFYIFLFIFILILCFVCYEEMDLYKVLLCCYMFSQLLCDMHITNVLTLVVYIFWVSCYLLLNVLTYVNFCLEEMQIDKCLKYCKTNLLL